MVIEKKFTENQSKFLHFLTKNYRFLIENINRPKNKWNESMYFIIKRLPFLSHCPIS
jgi:hypothetical protein